MKALEIIEYFGAEEMVNNNTPFEEQDYAEAIKELEEIEIRSCDNCKYWFYKTLETNIETCNFGLISHDYQSDSFYCNKWEAKK